MHGDAYLGKVFWHRWPWVFLYCCATVVQLGLIFPFSLHAEENSVEYKIKAGYLYNFSKFIEWPIGESPKNGQSLNICLLGNDHFGNVLDPIRTKKSKGRPIQLFRYEQMAAEVRQCKILFIADSEIDRVETIIGDLSGTSLLTVGDTEKFAAIGGMVGFVVKNGRVRLQINRLAVENAGLNISAKLLEVAQIVETQR